MVYLVFGLPFTVIVAFWFLTKLLLKDIKVIPLDTTSGSYVVPKPGVLEDLGFEVDDEDDFGLALTVDDFVLDVDEVVVVELMDVEEDVVDVATEELTLVSDVLLE